MPRKHCSKQAIHAVAVQLQQQLPGQKMAQTEHALLLLLLA